MSIIHPRDCNNSRFKCEIVITVRLMSIVEDHLSFLREKKNIFLSIQHKIIRQYCLII